MTSDGNLRTFKTYAFPATNSKRYLFEITSSVFECR